MKNFNEIYQKIYAESGQELNNLKSENRVRIIILLIIIFASIIIAFLLSSLFVVIIGVILFIFLSLVFGKNFKEYKFKYKNIVIKRFIKEYSETLDYNPEMGLASNIYNEAGFDGFYDIYNSEDLISGTILDGKKIEMAEVHTQRKEESTDSDGHTTTTYVTLFHGLFACIELETLINLTFKITKNNFLSDKLFRGKTKLDMDSGEFEKIFDVNTDDKISTLRILTSDVMQMLIDFKKEKKVVPEIVLKNNKLYIRFAVGNVFEPNSLKKDMDFDKLKKNYDMINFVFKLTEDFSKNILEFDQ